MPNNSIPARAQTFYLAGMHARDRNDPQAAKVLLRQAVDCDDATAQHHESFADLLTGEGNTLEAASHRRRAAQLRNAHAYARPAYSPQPSQPRPAPAAPPPGASAYRPAYSHLTERLRSGPPVSPATLGPCRTDAL